MLRHFVDHVDKEEGELVILGDFLELWSYPLENVISYNSALLDHLSPANITYVPGNHDAASLSVETVDYLPHPFFNKMVNPFVRTIGGKRFKFMHGHEVDPFMWSGIESTARYLRCFTNLIEPKNECIAIYREVIIEAILELGECIWILRNWIKKRLNRAVEQCCSVMPINKLQSLKRGLRLHNMLRRHNEHRSLDLYDVAIAGHTHRAGYFCDWYFNSGSWTGRTNNFLCIMPDGTVEVSDWSENGPRNRWTALRN